MLAADVVTLRAAVLPDPRPLLALAVKTVHFSEVREGRGLEVGPPHNGLQTMSDAAQRGEKWILIVSAAIGIGVVFTIEHGKPVPRWAASLLLASVVSFMAGVGAGTWRDVGPRPGRVYAAIRVILMVVGIALALAVIGIARRLIGS
ncbi:MAG TPA: hypothetical protein VGF28_09770 [Thermoanaerobaculia bacterium]|jgi:hypothetical protein